MAKQFIVEAARMQKLAGIIVENNSLIDQIIDVYTKLSYSAEGNEEDGTFNIDLDDSLRDLGLEFGFDGGDYIGKEDISHLDNNQLQSLMQSLNALK